MAVSKVILNGTTLIDITDTTAEASDVLSPEVFYGADGEQETGIYTPPTFKTQTKTVTPSENTQNVTPDSTYDGLSKVTVNPIPSQYIVPSGSKSITENGTSDVTSFASIDVNVQPSLQEKSITPTISTQEIEADSSYDGLSKVTVNPIPSQYIIPSGNLDITANGSTNVKNYETVNVDVQPNLRTASVTPTESSQTVTPGAEYDGLSEVTVGAISDTYVGSKIPQRSSSDLTASGAKVTVPSGYYASQATKSISTVTQATPSISINSSGLITASSSQSAGYVSSGTKSSTKQLTTQSAKTITPKTTSQQAVASGVYTTGIVTVGAIPSEYIIPTGSLSISNNGTGIDVTEYSSVDVNVQPSLQSKTVTPTETSQTVTASNGYYGLSDVTVNAISGTYVGSEVDRRTDEDLTTSGSTVTVPSGYYASNSSKSVTTTTQATPSVSINSTGLITATSTQSEGYVSSGTKTKTLQLATVGSSTIIPTKTSQTAVNTSVYTTGEITVGPIPSEYITTDDATATAEDLVVGTTAYVNGEKITGIREFKTALTWDDLKNGFTWSQLVGE